MQTLYATQIASISELKKNPTKVINDSQERILKQIGVDFIVNPQIEAGHRTAIIATNKKFIKLSKSFQNIGDNHIILTTKVNDVL